MVDLVAVKVEVVDLVPDMEEIVAADLAVESVALVDMVESVGVEEAEEAMEEVMEAVSAEA